MVGKVFPLSAPPFFTTGNQPRGLVGAVFSLSARGWHETSNYEVIEL